jgi:hypothetical protein
MRLATPGRTSGRWRHIARSFRSDEERDRARLPDEDVRGRAVLFSRSERTLAQFDTGFAQGGPHALAVAAVGPVEVRELPLYDEGGHAAHRSGDICGEPRLVRRIQQPVQRSGLRIVVVAVAVVPAARGALQSKRRLGELGRLDRAAERVGLVIRSK